MHGQGPRQARRVDHGDVGDDDALVAQPPQPPRHRRFRQADLFRQQARGLEIVAPDQGQQATVEGIEVGVFLHYQGLYACFLRHGR
ncbi:hypothetical protein D3C73_1232330 [compost metagenome]